ncbi:MAG TPA: hypothetical protein VMV94_02535, partial [Phycisphaerae bacterium]|nr:hypothetical protein [Phycisphaerae bacterium]
RGLSIALMSLVVLSGAAAQASLIETYDDGTDVGQWICSNNQPRVFQPTGGNPDMYLQQGGFSTSIPNWGTASPRYQPGFNDTYKIDSVFVGDWTSAGVTTLSTDLNVLHVGSWQNRPVTLKIMQMDDTGFSVNYSATWSTDNMATPPIGWNHYDFTINAAGGVVPIGWIFTRGDGTPGTDADWATFLSRVDLVQFMYARPGTMYTSFGSWTLGIDNISIQTVPEPATVALALLGLPILLGRRNRS